MFRLDLKHVRRWIASGDITIALLVSKNANRYLILMPSVRRADGWVVIPESMAYLWAVDSEDVSMKLAALAHTATAAERACNVLGLEPNSANKARVIGLVNSWIPDLIRLRAGNIEEELTPSLGTNILRADGAVVSETDVRLERETGVVYAH